MPARPAVALAARAAEAEVAAAYPLEEIQHMDCASLVAMALPASPRVPALPWARAEVSAQVEWRQNFQAGGRYHCPVVECPPAGGRYHCPAVECSRAGGRYHCPAVECSRAGGRYHSPVAACSRVGGR